MEVYLTGACNKSESSHKIGVNVEVWSYQLIVNTKLAGLELMLDIPALENAH